MTKNEKNGTEKKYKNELEQTLQAQTAIQEFLRIVEVVMPVYEGVVYEEHEKPGRIAKKVREAT